LIVSMDMKAQIHEELSVSRLNDLKAEMKNRARVVRDLLDKVASYDQCLRTLEENTAALDSYLSSFSNFQRYHQRMKPKLDKDIARTALRTKLAKSRSTNTYSGIGWPQIHQLMTLKK